MKISIHTVGIDAMVDSLENDHIDNTNTIWKYFRFAYSFELSMLDLYVLQNGIF